MLEKWLAVILGIYRSPLTPLKKGGIGIKVPLLKGDNGGSRTFCYRQENFKTSSYYKTRKTVYFAKQSLSFWANSLALSGLNSIER